MIDPCLPGDPASLQTGYVFSGGITGGPFGTRDYAEEDSEPSQRGYGVRWPWAILDLDIIVISYG